MGLFWRYQFNFISRNIYYYKYFVNLYNPTGEWSIFWSNQTEIYQLWPKFRGFGCETVLSLECITAVVTCMMVEIFIVSRFDFRITWILEDFEIVVFVQRVLVWLAWFQNCWLDQDTRWIIIKMSSPSSKRRTNRESPMQRRFSKKKITLWKLKD